MLKCKIKQHAAPSLWNLQLTWEERHTQSINSDASRTWFNVNTAAQEHREILIRLGRKGKEVLNKNMCLKITWERNKIMASAFHGAGV